MKKISKLKTMLINFFSLSLFKISKKRKFFFYLGVFLVSLLFTIRTVYSQKFTQVPIVKSFIDILLFYFIIITILNILKIVIISVYRKINKIKSDHKDNLIMGIESLSLIILVMTLFIGTLQFINLDLKTFFGSFALISVAFAWVFKEYITNIIDGILIIFSDDFIVGNYIMVGNYRGRIREITFLNTEIITDEGDIVFIPNTLIIQREVTNYSKVKYKRIIHEFEIDKSLFTKVRKIEKVIIKNLIKDFDDIFEVDKFFLKVVKIKHDSAILSAEMPVKSYSFKIEEQMEKCVSLTIMEFIDREEDND
jgi:small-conductance mechanosensitive channel